MGYLRENNIKELLEKADNIAYYLFKHNKNYNKEQYYKIDELGEIIRELKERLY